MFIMFSITFINNKKIIINYLVTFIVIKIIIIIIIIIKFTEVTRGVIIKPRGLMCVNSCMRPFYTAVL